MSNQQQKHNLFSEVSGASSSSRLPSTNNNNPLPQPLTATDMAPFKKSKDSNKAIHLKRQEIIY